MSTILIETLEEYEYEKAYSHSRIHLTGIYTTEPMQARHLEREKQAKYGRFDREKLKGKKVTITNRDDLIEAIKRIFKNETVSARDYITGKSIYNARIMAAQTLRDRKDNPKKVNPNFLASADTCELYDLMRKSKRREEIRTSSERSLNEILFHKYRTRDDSGRLN